MQTITQGGFLITRNTSSPEPTSQMENFSLRIRKENQKTRTPNQRVEIPCKQVDNDTQMVRQVCVSMQEIRHEGINQDTLAHIKYRTSGWTSILIY